MRKLVVGTFLTLDGVMQAPGGPDEDRDGGFQHGGWLVPYFDEKLVAIMNEGTKRAGAFLLGRKTYEIFADYGPNWDNPCPSCTSLMDGFDRTWYQVTQHAAFVAIAKAPAERINAWAKKRGWSQIALVSGAESSYQADYKCQGDSDDMQLPVMHVFRRQDGKILHFWGTETSANHLDTVWPYWNLMDFTPEGRPDIPTPPQKFRSEFLEKHYLNKE